MGRGTSAKYIFERHFIYTLILWESKKKGSEGWRVGGFEGKSRVRGAEDQRLIEFVELIGFVELLKAVGVSLITSI